MPCSTLRSARRIALLLALALLALGCAASHGTGVLPPDARSPRYDDEVPAWVGEPLSWSHLSAVEA